MLRLNVEKLDEVAASGDVSVGQFDPSDEYHGALDSLQEVGAIEATNGELIAIYPESNAEDRPLVAVNTGHLGGLLLLGGELKVWADEPGDDNPASLQVIAQRAVDEANALLHSLQQFGYGYGGDDEDDEPEPPTACPSCGGGAICAQTREDQEPWACLDCSHEWTP